MIGNIEDLKAFATANGYTLEDEELALALRQINLWLWSLPWCGEKVDPAQADIWPRVICDDYNCLEYDVPQQVITFVYTAACDAAENGVDVTTVSSGPKKKAFAITGAISVEYDQNSLYSEDFAPAYMQGMIGGWLCGSTNGAMMKLQRN
ncbi:head-tail adaptor [Klebsiella phage VLCpiS8a]|nr:head-tail adaptor [Klebsiella phage VLCpiS8a]